MSNLTPLMGEARVRRRFIDDAWVTYCRSTNGIIDQRLTSINYEKQASLFHNIVFQTLPLDETLYDCYKIVCYC